VRIACTQQLLALYQGGKMKTASVNLTQKEASLLLKLLEASFDHPDTDKNVEKAMHRIWDEIFDKGLAAGFGGAK